MLYDRIKAIQYAHKWAFGRNPSYGNFDGMGGDCTNFISQCLFSGCGVMNYKKDTGWYYKSMNDRAAAWTSVGYLHSFLTTNRGKGPRATTLSLDHTLPGDIIQLSFDGYSFAHSLLVVDISPQILIATHTENSDYRSLNTYYYKALRLLHIDDIVG